MTSDTPMDPTGTLSADLLDGMLLAATVADDRDGSEATPGLTPGLARAFGQRAEALASLDTEPRRAEIRRLAGRLRAIAPSADLPVGARALLAGSLPRKLARKWAAQAPPVRRGFRLDPSLKATLRRLAHPMVPDAHELELKATADADPRLLRWAEPLAREAGIPEEVDRVLGALALGAAGKMAGDADSTKWHRIGAELKLAWESPWQK